MTHFTGNATVLLIDDTPSNLGVVVSLFEDRGYRVVIAQDGEEGLQRAQLVQPDLILLDVMMPGVDGFETCQRLKAQQSTRDIPVIFMTALAMPEHKVKGFQAGAVDYVTKPLQIDEVMARVDTHLKLHAAQKCLAEQNAQLDKHRAELEQRVAERTAELAAREREFRTLAVNLPDNLARYDKQYRNVYMNPQLESFLGIESKIRLGKTPTEAHTGLHYVEYQARMAETITTGLPGEMELVLPDTGEGIRYHHIRFVAERNGGGEIVGALTIGRDITERKQTERKLLLLNAAVNASSDAVFLMNAQGRFIYVNEQACRSLGYSREELLTMSPLDIDPDITAEFLDGLLVSTLNLGLSKSLMESHHRTKDGRVFPIEIASSSITVEGNNYYLTMVRDITERKKSECLLHEQQQEISAVVENSPDVISRYDRKLRRTYVNPATEKLYGIPASAIIGKTVAELPPAIEGFAHILHTVFASGKGLSIEVLFHWPNGERGWGDARLVPEFGADGQIASVLSIGRDITERKRIEFDLKESRALLRGLTARREQVREEERKYIAREVHDELGQILTGLKLNISVLNHKLAADSIPLSEHLKQALMLIDRSLEVARNVATALRPAALDMGIASSLEWLADRYGKNTGISCSVSIEDDELQLEESHAIALFRIVQESLTNVARHAHADKVMVALEQQAGEYVLTVRDNGVGFDMLTSKAGSFGLVGIQERALILDGTATINSSPGNGTEIVVRIPAQKNSEEI
jgi:PAS domain S-box-containing protein